MTPRLVVIAHPDRRALAIGKRYRVPADQLVIVRKPADLDNTAGLPFIFDHSAWNLRHADRIAEWVGRRMAFLPRQ